MNSKFDYPSNQSTGGCSTFATTAENGHPIFARNYDWFMENQLRNNPNPSLKEAMSYLDAIHYSMQDKDTALQIANEGYDPEDERIWSWITIDSSVYDLADKTLNICIQEDYSKTYSFALDYSE